MSNENKPKAETSLAPWSKTKAIFDQYPEDKFNRLMPTLTAADVAGEFQKPTVELVRIDPTVPGIGESGEVYRDKRMKEGYVALGRRALNKFQHAAGLIFPPQLNGVQSLSPTSCLYKATGAMKKADGSLLMITASKLVDLELEEIKAREDLLAKNEYRKRDEAAGKTYNDGSKVLAWTPEEIEAKVRRHVLQARENMVQNAETKAMNRVIRKALALKDAYPVEELKKPFALIRFDTSFDISDPAQAKMILAQASLAQGALYGDAGRPAGEEVAQVGPSAIKVEAADAIEPDIDDPLDSFPEEEDSPEGDFPAENAAPEEDPLRSIVALGYEGMKKRFNRALDKLTLSDEGEREQILRAWRLVHASPAEERAEFWARLILQIEERARG